MEVDGFKLDNTISKESHFVDGEEEQGAFSKLEAKLVQCLLLGAIDELSSICKKTNFNSTPLNTKTYVETVLRYLLLEVTVKEVINCFKEFLNQNEQWSRKKSSFENIKYDTEKVLHWKVILKECLINNNDDENDLENMKLVELRVKLEDLQCHEKYYLPYNSRWLKTNVYQAAQYFLQQEQQVEQGIQQTIAACELQSRVHSEIITYLDLYIQELKNQLEHWEELYTKEKSEIKIKLQNVNDARHELKDKHQTLSSLFQEHKNEMEVYIGERTARQKAYEYECHLNRMATKIQAWWRGTIVRRQMGPYKLDKKKKHKDKLKKTK